MAAGLQGWGGAWRSHAAGSAPGADGPAAGRGQTSGGSAPARRRSAIGRWPSADPAASAPGGAAVPTLKRRMEVGVPMMPASTERLEVAALGSSTFCRLWLSSTSGTTCERRRRRRRRVGRRGRGRAAACSRSGAGPGRLPGASQTRRDGNRGPGAHRGEVLECVQVSLARAAGGAHVRLSIRARTHAQRLPGRGHAPRRRGRGDGPAGRRSALDGHLHAVRSASCCWN